MILGKMIIDRVPGCEMVRLVNSGTEATMSVVRLARGITGKDKIIKFSGCYHGHADSFLIQAGSGALTFGEPNSPGITKSTAQDTLIAQFNDIQTVEDHFVTHRSEISCVILEPINGNAGCILPKDGFLQDLRVLCNDNDALLIFDEVMTGFRVSKGGAAEYFSITPDLYTFGKIIGGGLPIGAYAGRKEFMEHMSPVGSIYQAGTLSGNPIAVSAGIATLELLNDEIYDELEILGKYFQDSLQVIIDKNEFGHILFQERVGSMFSLFFHPGPIQNVNDVMGCDFKMFAKYFNGLLDKGIYIAPSQHEVGFLSIAHTRSILDSTLSVMNVVLDEIMVLA
jgi:glutamate-1-semialdehyde 2,1-aminomutase